MNRRSAAIVLGLLALSACRTTPEQNYAKGLASMKRGDYQLAREQFMRANLQNPNSIETKYQLAMVEVKLQDLKDAYSLLREAEDKDRGQGPLSVPVRIELAKLFTSTKQYDQAHKRIIWVLQRDPHNKEAHQVLATSLALQAQPQAAQEQLDLLLADDPGSLNGRILAATLHLAAHEADQAEAALQEGVAANQRSSDSLVALANFYQLTRQPAKAIPLLTEGVQRAPQNIPIRKQLGWVYAQAGDRAAAEKAFRDIAQLAPTNLSAQMALADFYTTTSDWPKAAVELEALVKKYPGVKEPGPELRGLLASAYYRNGRRADARKLDDQLIAENNKDANAHLLNGLLHLDAREFEQATTEFDHVLHDQSDSAPAEYLLALASLGAGKEQVAQQRMEQALQLRKDMLPARLWLMDYSLKRGSNDVVISLARSAPESQASAPEIVVMTALCNPEADLSPDQQAALQSALLARPRFILSYQDLGMTTLLRKYGGPLRTQMEGLVKKFPQYAPAQTILQAILEAQGKQELALAQVQKRVATNPKSTVNLMVLARFQIQMGYFKEALGTLDKVAALEPDNPEMLVRMAEVESRTGYVDAALQRLETLTKRYPKSSEAWAFKAIVYQQKGALKDARTFYEQALQLDSQNAVAANNLSLLMATSFSDGVGAVSLARRAHTIDPSNPDFDDTLGWVLYLGGNFQDALPSLGDAVRMKPEDATFRYHLGIAQSHAGRDKEALASLGTALRLNPGIREASEIKSEIATIIPRTTR